MADPIDWGAWFERRDEIFDDIHAGEKRRKVEEALDDLYAVQYAPALAERDELKAEVKRLRSQLAMHLTAWREAYTRANRERGVRWETEEHADWLSGRLAIRRARERRVRDVHPSMQLGDRTVCEACRDASEEPLPYPCPTIAALDVEPGA